MKINNSQSTIDLKSLGLNCPGSNSNSTIAISMWTDDDDHRSTTLDRKKKICLLGHVSGVFKYISVLDTLASQMDSVKPDVVQFQTPSRINI